jgi:DNA-binding IscR family transcriptional regulator
MGQGCAIACECPIRTPIRRLHAQLHRFLESVSIEDLLDDHIVTPHTPPRLTALMHPGCKE